MGPVYRSVNGALVEMTAEEVAQFEAERLNVPPPPRMVPAIAFSALFTAAEKAALFADPVFLSAAFDVAAQNSANLDSPRLAALLNRAVTEGKLSADRAADIIAGRSPPS